MKSFRRRKLSRGTLLAINPRIGGAIVATPFLSEVSMLGRRSHARVSLESDAEGVLSLARDIWVRVSDAGLLIAISRDAVAVGERVRVQLSEDDVDLFAEIIESKPMVCDGAVRHRLVMRCPDRESGSFNTTTGRAR